MFILLVPNWEKILSIVVVVVWGQVKSENSSLPVAVRVSETHVLKFCIILLFCLVFRIYVNIDSQIAYVHGTSTKTLFLGTALSLSLEPIVELFYPWFNLVRFGAHCTRVRSIGRNSILSKFRRKNSCGNGIIDKPHHEAGSIMVCF